MGIFGKKRIYMDYASTTPVLKEVYKEMKVYFGDIFYNPSALYKEGFEAREAVENSRDKIASLLKCSSKEVIFLSGGSEANNFAIKGIFSTYSNSKERPKFLVSKTEHPSVSDLSLWWNNSGGKSVFLENDNEGIISANSVEKLLDKDTVLVSIIYVNNEIGSINPIKEISRRIKKWKEKNKIPFNHPPFFHIDASQAPNYLPIEVNCLGIDLMTLDATKIYGPKGIGCLYKKHGINIDSLIQGGGQEEGYRAGTENVPLIVGFAKSLEIAVLLREKEDERLKVIRNYFISELKREFPNCSINGSIENRVANNINVCFPGLDGEFAVFELDTKGVMCTSVTTCKNFEDKPRSRVIEAIGKPECASSSLRFTLGKFSKKSDIDFTIKVLKEII